MEKENEKTKPQGMSETVKNILFFLIVGLIISLCFTGRFIYDHGNPIHFEGNRANVGDAIWICTNYKATSERDSTYDLEYVFRFASEGEDVLFTVSTDMTNTPEGVITRHDRYTVSQEVYKEIIQIINEENLSRDTTSNSNVFRPLDPNGLDYPVLIIVSSSNGSKYFYADSSAVVTKCEELDTLNTVGK